jgi:hypothetical protein
MRTKWEVSEEKGAKTQKKRLKRFSQLKNLRGIRASSARVYALRGKWRYYNEKSGKKKVKNQKKKNTRCTGRKRGDYSLGEGLKYARDTAKYTIRRKNETTNSVKCQKVVRRFKKNVKKSLNTAQ